MDVKVQNVTVSFPFQPYTCQLSIMHRIVEALNSQRNCLLESPTGTGKTLALLCATLAWLEKQKNICSLCDDCNSGALLTEGKRASETKASDDNVNLIEAGQCLCDKSTKLPKIFFCTRTHKQISQIVRELRQTKYAHTRMTILSSRKHTCINPEVRKSLNPTESCQNLRTISRCLFDVPRRNADLSRAINRLDKRGPWDIEDLVSTLIPVPSCPYFCSRKLMKTADLIICPYNYLLDPINRSSTALDTKNSIVILDEAHNIEDSCREAASFKIMEEQLIMAKENLETLIKHQFEVDSSRPLLMMMEAMLRLMQLTRARLVRLGESAQPTQIWTGPEIAGLLGTVGLGPDQVPSIERAFHKLASTVANDSGESDDRYLMNDVTNQSKLRPSAGTLRLLESLFTVLGYMFKKEQTHLTDYRMVLTETVSYERTSASVSDANEVDGSQGSWLSKRATKARLVEARELSLNFWCLNPSVVFSELDAEAHSLILTSGTLSPLDALEAELGVTFPIRLETNHVVSRDRVLVAAVSHGPTAVRLCANYQNQITFEFQDELGRLILEACKLVVPGSGVLCFFPSYSLLERLVERWELTGMLAILRSLKHTMIEPRQSVDLTKWLREFYASLGDRTTTETCSNPSSIVYSGKVYSQPAAQQTPTTTGTVAFAVCRGKVSEGLDFTDHYARLVIAVGIPYPAYKNPQIQQKREFNNTARRLSMDSGIYTQSSPLRNQQCVSPKVIGTSADTAESSQQQPSAALRPPLFLSGDAWYSAQAYRALNQALGRCIRHTKDWGAVLLVDSRFVEMPSRYMPGISRWIRSRATFHTQWSMVEQQLTDFFALHQAEAKSEKDLTELGDIFAD